MKTKTITALTSIFWTLAVGCSLLWNIYLINQYRMQLVSSIGEAFFKEIETTRLWNARHGGVYVPVTPETQPNPYLKVPDRDLVTQEGKLLTKINPAFMTRQIAELALTQSGVQFHITSLNPIRPENKADLWETKALKSFEEGVKSTTEYIKAENSYRFMAPLWVESSCLACHKQQGYKIGDIRGGISITMPVKVYPGSSQKLKTTLATVHIAFWIAGLLGIIAFTRYRERNLKLLHQKNISLKQEIDQRIQVETQLLQARDQAESASKAKSRFLANMSHELRTPFNAILGFSQLIQKSEDVTEEHRDHLNIIIQSAENLLRLINQILDLTKIESGKMELQNHPFDLETLLKGLINVFKLQAEKKNINLTFNLPSEIPKLVSGDEIKLRQVLTNLLGNAIKFTQETGAVSLQVWQKATDTPSTSSGETLCFEVEDNGPGIKPEELDQLFNRFVQTSTGRESHEGTGLGLNLSQHLLELMGGKLTVSSEPFVRTRFSFELNLPEVDLILPNNELIPQRIIGLEPDQTRFRVLIVDDREFNRLLLLKLLTPLGFSVKEAANGQEAIKTWESWSPHLILMDLKMPVLGGIEAIQQIKAIDKGKQTKIVIITASVFDEAQSVVQQTGCDGFLRKPFQQHEFYTLLQEQLEVRYLYRDQKSGEPQRYAPDAEPTDTSPAAILLVDDIAANRRYLEQLLKSWAVSVEMAENGQQAMDKIRKNRYDLVLMDLEMPIVDGYQATKEIRSWEKENQVAPTTIVAITASDEAVQSSLTELFDQVLAKPIRPGQLNRVLSELVPHSSMSEAQSLEAETILVELDSQLEDLIPALLKEITETLEQIEKVLPELDFKTISRLADGLKGATATYNLPDLSERFMKLEKAALQQDKDSILHIVTGIRDYVVRCRFHFTENIRPSK